MLKSSPNAASHEPQIAVAVAPLSLYCIFHLNIAYSSIEEEQRPQVLERCYWPLLHLIRSTQLPCGIEATGYTLEVIEQLDPAWLHELRALIDLGWVELIGSGYTQLIGPLVPSVVNTANLRLGHFVYQRLLGSKPRIALINEQAFSAGLVEHYLAADYRAIVMEWDNPASQHPQWPRELGWRPQRVLGNNGATIPVIWNHSIAFQKFQRYAHGEMSLGDYLDYLRKQHVGADRVVALYGNDVEIFDFRPGRYHTEAPLMQQSEWGRIGHLWQMLKAEPGFKWIKPSELLARVDVTAAPLQLGSAAQPIPVKKQRKYNLGRWAITGRDDLWLNTACHRFAQKIISDPVMDQDDQLWRRLCRLWASDLRTHITSKRWEQALVDAQSFAEQLGVVLLDEDQLPLEPASRERAKGEFEISRDTERHLLHVKSPRVHAVFNMRRGLVLDSLAFAEHDFVPVVGTLPHGYFDSIELGADFYTGGVVVELPGEHKRITDLDSVEPEVIEFADRLMVSCSAKTAKGIIRKELTIYAQQSRIDYGVAFPAWSRPKGTVRVGYVTLLPEAFARPLKYACHNGGREMEVFELNNQCLHDQPVSALVSCTTGLGATAGEIQIGDSARLIRLKWNPARCAAFPLIHHQASKPSSLTRVVFSLAEIDDTSRDGGHLQPFSMSLTPAPGISE